MRILRHSTHKIITSNNCATMTAATSISRRKPCNVRIAGRQRPVANRQQAADKQIPLKAHYTVNATRPASQPATARREFTRGTAANKVRV